MTATTTPNPEDRDPWRTRLLALSALLLCTIGGLALYDFTPDLVRYLQAPKTTTRTFLMVTPIMVTAAHVLLGVGALWAMLRRGDPARSRTILLRTFTISLLLQIVPRLVPTQWYVHPAADEALGTAILLTLGGCLDLAPLLLSITTGVSRAGLRCIRVTGEPRLGAVLLVVTNLQLTLLVAVLFAMIEPGGTPAWLQGGVLLLLVHFGVATWVCTNLLRERCAQRTFDRLLRGSTLLLLLPAVAMLGRGLWQTELLGMHFLRLEGQPGIYPPWHLLVEAIYFVGRSLITMLAAQDLLLRSRDRDT